MRALRLGLLTAGVAFVATVAAVISLSGPSPQGTTTSSRIGSIIWLSCMLCPVPTALGFLLGASVGALLGNSSHGASGGGKRVSQENTEPAAKPDSARRDGS